MISALPSFERILPMGSAGYTTFNTIIGGDLPPLGRDRQITRVNCAVAMTQAGKSNAYNLTALLRCGGTLLWQGTASATSNEFEVVAALIQTDFTNPLLWKHGDQLEFGIGVFPTATFVFANYTYNPKGTDVEPYYATLTWEVSE